MPTHGVQRDAAAHAAAARAHGSGQISNGGLVTLNNRNPENFGCFKQVYRKKAIRTGDIQIFSVLNRDLRGDVTDS